MELGLEIIKTISVMKSSNYSFCGPFFVRILTIQIFDRIYLNFTELES